ncbi:unnamed protein product [Closterium sp. Naga37s-1]|nr:unnamed protein product [Closterium sp. Naga37s-1]
MYSAKMGSLSLFFNLQGSFVSALLGVPYGYDMMTAVKVAEDSGVHVSPGLCSLGSAIRLLGVPYGYDMMTAVKVAEDSGVRVALVDRSSFLTLIRLIDQTRRIPSSPPPIEERGSKEGRKARFERVKRQMVQRARDAGCEEPAATFDSFVTVLATAFKGKEIPIHDFLRVRSCVIPYRPSSRLSLSTLSPSSPGKEIPIDDFRRVRSCGRRVVETFCHSAIHHSLLPRAVAALRCSPRVVVLLPLWTTPARLLLSGLPCPTLPPFYRSLPSRQGDPRKEIPIDDFRRVRSCGRRVVETFRHSAIHHSLLPPAAAAAFTPPSPLSAPADTPAGGSIGEVGAAASQGGSQTSQGGVSPWCPRRHVRERVPMEAVVRSAIDTDLPPAIVSERDLILAQSSRNNQSRQGSVSPWCPRRHVRERVPMEAVVRSAIDTDLPPAIVTERDLILAQNIRKCTAIGPTVAVVGAGHIPGITHRWNDALSPSSRMEVISYLLPPSISRQISPDLPSSSSSSSSPDNATSPDEPRFTFPITDSFRTAAEATPPVKPNGRPDFSEFPSPPKLGPLVIAAGLLGLSFYRPRAAMFIGVGLGSGIVASQLLVASALAKAGRVVGAIEDAGRRLGEEDGAEALW